MASACCPHWSCPCEQLIKPAARRQQQNHDQDYMDFSPVTNMDIALLTDQYNSIRQKQKHETRVICFRKATSSNEELSGKSLVNVVPMRQVQRSFMKQASSKEIHFDFAKDPESATWRTHLGMYRRTFTAHDTNQNQVTKVMTKTEGSTSASVDNSKSSVENMKTNDQLCEDFNATEGSNTLCNKEQKFCDSECPRKFTERAFLFRQISCGSYRSGQSPEGPNYYPFPQLKCPKKSEAARRLGLYSSF